MSANTETLTVYPPKEDNEASERVSESGDSGVGREGVEVDSGSEDLD